MVLKSSRSMGCIYKEQPSYLAFHIPFSKSLLLPSTAESISMMSNKEGDLLINLPPGFRFHPTDEELLAYYLYRKTAQTNFSALAIGEVDIYKYEPWDLPWKAKMGDDEWYFFCLRDRKYQIGSRSNRATEAGFWKSTGRDGEIYRGRWLIGMKKTLVFYKGRSPRAEKTNWVMHEYRLDGKLSVPNSSTTNEWIICRVFRKALGTKTAHISYIKTLESIGNGHGSSVSVAVPPPVVGYSPMNVSCFSSQYDDGEDQARISNSAGNSLLGIFSSPQEFLPRIHHEAPVNVNLPPPDSALTVQERNFLDSVLENHGFMAEMEEIVGVSPETGQTTTHLDQQNPSAPPLELDNLNSFWSYYD